MYVVEMYDAELHAWIECSPRLPDKESGLRYLERIRKEHPPFKFRLVKKEEIA